MEKNLKETRRFDKESFGFFAVNAIRNHQRKILDHSRSRETTPLAFEQANIDRQKTAVKGWFMGMAS